MAAPLSHAVKFSCANKLKSVYGLSSLNWQNVRHLSAITNNYLNTLLEPKLNVVGHNSSLFESSQFRCYTIPTTEEPDETEAKEQRIFSTAYTYLHNFRSQFRQYTIPTAEQSNETAAKEQTKREEEPEISEDLKKLTEEIAALTARANDLEDKYKRSLAETENVRQRMKKQIDDSRLFAIQGFCKDLLDVADVLQKATESVPKEELEKGNQHLLGLHDGLIMTEKELQKVFTRHGLVKLDPVGEKFDPNCHEAIFCQPFPGKTPGHVAVVTKIGYKLHNRTIRPAIVGVAKEA